MLVSYRSFIGPLGSSCNICLDSFDRERIPYVHHANPDAGHPVHLDCVRKWSHIRPSCPTCNVDINPLSIFSWKEYSVHQLKCAGKDLLVSSLSGLTLGLITLEHRLILIALSIFEEELASMNEQPPLRRDELLENALENVVENQITYECFKILNDLIHLGTNCRITHLAKLLDIYRLYQNVGYRSLIKPFLGVVASAFLSSLFLYDTASKIQLVAEKFSSEYVIYASLFSIVLAEVMIVCPYYIPDNRLNALIFFIFNSALLGVSTGLFQRNIKIIKFYNHRE